MTATIDRLKLAIGMVATITIIGIFGYRAFGLSWLDAMYMTVISITTVGYREIGGLEDEFTAQEKFFTMFIIVTGVACVLYTFTLVVQVVVEGQLRAFVGRRRMDRQISHLRGHVIVCGWGRVGRAVASGLLHGGQDVVVVDRNEERVRDLPFRTVVGDATSDAILRTAGVDRAQALVAALEGDAENLFVTLSCKALNPDLFIVARARQDESVPKLEHAGADRVVNPQELGAARMASFVTQPNVAEFVDVVMHEQSLEFRMQEFDIPPDSPIAGKTLSELDLREKTGALVLALRAPNGPFITNPRDDTTMQPHHVLIAVGTSEDLERLTNLVTPAATAADG
jgi:voltage-gated potassium channel